MNKKIISVVILCFVFILSFFSLSQRLEFEKKNKQVCLATDFKDIGNLALLTQRTQNEIYDELYNCGVRAIVSGEYNIVTSSGVVTDGLKLLDGGSVAGLKLGQAVLFIANNYGYKNYLLNYIAKKYPLSQRLNSANGIYIGLPVSVEEIATVFYLPDFQGLDFARKNNIPVVFRLGASVGVDGAMVASYMDEMVKFCPSIFSLCVAGVIVPAYPDVKPLAEQLKKHNISLSLIEFVKQIGTANFAKEMSPFVLQLHSLTKDEIINRNLTKKTVLDRYVRAIHERSIRILLLHPYDLQMADKLEDYMADISFTRDALVNHGFTMGLPQYFPNVKASPFASLAISLFFIVSLFYFSSLFTEKPKFDITTMLLGGLFTLALAFVLYRYEFVSRLFGGFCAGLGATVATLVALDVKSPKKLVNYLLAILFVFAGGTSIAAFYGTTEAIVRVAPFSGVKLTLLLPILLVLVYDMLKRVHPESPREIVLRPALWGELALLGCVLLALLVMTIRSGNVEEVSSSEMAFRNLLERIFIVRPRTKEFLLGYPAVILYCYIARNNFIPHYREVFRLAACVAFGSSFNTFCHFHTAYYMTLIRVANGMILGTILGIFIVILLKIVLKCIRKRYNYEL
ncbi:MAG: DUF5693 family protein [Synergistaceae bacterium]|nr:DUF5693 family protein [Synergistaceae bacterium]